MSNPIDKIRTHFFHGVTDLFRAHMEAEYLYLENSPARPDVLDKPVMFVEMATEMLVEVIRLGLPEAQGEAVLSDLNMALGVFMEGLTDTIAEAKGDPDPWDFYRETVELLNAAHLKWASGEKDAASYLAILKASMGTLIILVSADKTPPKLNRAAQDTLKNVRNTIDLIHNNIERAEREAGWDPTP